jgi:hypothetical protein
MIRRMTITAEHQMFRGSEFDRSAQQRVFAERGWIDAQPGLVAQGRAVLLFNAENRSPQFLEELIERFYRVFVFIDTAQEADWMSRIGAAGHRAYPYKVFVARKQLEYCKSLVDREPPLRGASVIHLSDCGERQVAAAAGLLRWWKQRHRHHQRFARRAGPRDWGDHVSPSGNSGIRIFSNRACFEFGGLSEQESGRVPQSRRWSPLKPRGLAERPRSGAEPRTVRHAGNLVVSARGQPEVDRIPS